MSSFILVNPNNELIRTTTYTIPNLENYRVEILGHLTRLKNSEFLSSQKHETVKRRERLIAYKNAELKYVESYLIILKNLDLISQTCQRSGSRGYDYEKENDILFTIEDETKLFKQYEADLVRKKELYEAAGTCKTGTNSGTSERGIQEKV